ncbi:hypothetical protein CTI12_AA438970 [Artemisia annua]|uniref:Uncharacterized protein n=1 Tax=Artemisia annua TaxID=35608 RepID=A0A2U1LYJ2_ARTAN|nr:hypothetical protein CTI12_AA438970 [Artemisia annua]
MTEAYIRTSQRMSSVKDMAFAPRRTTTGAGFCSVRYADASHQGSPALLLIFLCCFWDFFSLWGNVKSEKGKQSPQGNKGGKVCCSQGDFTHASSRRG